MIGAVPPPPTSSSSTSSSRLMLLPMYLVIGVCGRLQEPRICAAIKFFLFTIAGSLLMLLGDPLSRLPDSNT